MPLQVIGLARQIVPAQISNIWLSYGMVFYTGNISISNVFSWPKYNYSGPCILRAPIQPESLKLKVVSNGGMLYWDHKELCCW